jgi:pimeloyl-ACP methyl ester carboxylesterase
MRWSNAVVRASVVALLAAAALIPGLTAASAAPAGATCSDVTLPVSIAAGGPKQYSMYGRLCQPSGGPSKTIQILIHGYTYDHDYWALPGFDGKYDYTAVANAAGYTTFAVDRLGSAGESSRPPSALVNLLSNAASMHDVVTAARDGSLPGGPYGKVLTVGHSYGTAAAWQEAAQFNDVDGIIASDLGHPLGNIQGLGTSTIPALTDPRLQPLVGLDAGYTTTTPGSRGPLFYRLEDTDPAVLAYDEKTKGIGTATELGTIPLYETATLGIRVPMLFVMGQYDGFFCRQAGKGAIDDCSTAATLAAAEKPFFPLVPDFQAYVLPNAGHDINNELNAGDWFAKAADWATTNFPPQG